VSEYQYYEFLAIDRPLDARQQRELRALSTRARITSTRFVNTYHWGDFKGDPRLLMSRYFDAFLYLANWGTRQLMFRLPAAVLDLEVASHYCASDSACAWPAGDDVIVEMTSEKEDDYWEEGAEDSLSSIIAVRSELAGGDRRLLYLAWLLSVDAGESKDTELEPAVPPGLATLSATLQTLVEFLRLDEDLLSVAAEASKPLDPVEPSAAELTGWVTRLPAEEKDALLARLVSGDLHIGMELARRFRGERDGSGDEKGRRTAVELQDAARRHREQRAQLAAQRRTQEQARREHAQAAARERHLAALAPRQEQAWEHVYAAIATRQPARYDEAVELLGDLRAVSEREQRLEAFDRRLVELRQQHSKKQSLLQRLEHRGLGAGSANVRLE
jgi:FtsZ-interacting cell division protein YlmF